MPFLGQSQFNRYRPRVVWICVVIWVMETREHPNLNNKLERTYFATYNLMIKAPRENGQAHTKKISERQTKAGNQECF